MAEAPREPGSEDLVYSENIREWERVDRRTYTRYEPYLGMVIVSKGADGNIDNDQHPPGYQYVGNDRSSTVGDDAGSLAMTVTPCRRRDQK